MSQQEEYERRLTDALDALSVGKATQDDLFVIRYATGLRNYTPRKE